MGSRAHCRCCRWTKSDTDRRPGSTRPPHSRSPSAPRRSASSAILSKLADCDRRPAIAQLNRRPAIRLKKIIGPVRQQAHRAGGLDHRRGRRRRNADRPVAVQVIVETGLVRRHLDARPREWDRELIAAAVGQPNLILIGARDRPGHLIAARRLRRGDRRPGAILGKFADCDWRPAIAQLDRRPVSG